ncbi:MAG: LuxR C-terminal-related transcriptional regulator [Deltaproteobacteria bacterium]|jgi:DNA-binding CsgD family transcriptional regulator|nr:LuxR C-terminal-related transcriptional regulator [Deltaproteobacteria bacterium]
MKSISEQIDQGNDKNMIETDTNRKFIQLGITSILGTMVSILVSCQFNSREEYDRLRQENKNNGSQNSGFEIGGDFELFYADQEHNTAVLILDYPFTGTLFFDWLGETARAMVEHLITYYSLSLDYLAKKLGKERSELEYAREQLYFAFGATNPVQLLFKLVSKAPTCPQPPDLTEAEGLVLAGITQGLSMGQIANFQQENRNSIHFRRGSIIRKLDARNINEAVIIALRQTGKLKNSEEVFDDYEIFRSLSNVTSDTYGLPKF